MNRQLGSLMKKLASLAYICGVVSLVIGLALSLFIQPARADTDPNWDRSSLTFDDNFSCKTNCDNHEVRARVCNTGEQMAGDTNWELYYIASGNPMDGSIVANGTVSALANNECREISASVQQEGVYKFKVYQRPGHPVSENKESVLWSGSCQVSCQPPENPTEVVTETTDEPTQEVTETTDEPTQEVTETTEDPNPTVTEETQDPNPTVTEETQNPNPTVTETTKTPEDTTTAPTNQVLVDPTTTTTPVPPPGVLPTATSTQSIVPSTKVPTLPPPPTQKANKTPLALIPVTGADLNAPASPLGDLNRVFVDLGLALLGMGLFIHGLSYRIGKG